MHSVVLFQIRKFEELETDEERIKEGKNIYDTFIMKELLAQSHVGFFWIVLDILHMVLNKKCLQKEMLNASLFNKRLYR